MKDVSLEPALSRLLQGVEAEDKALNATYSQILHDLAVHGMYVARDGVRVNPDDFYCEPPAKTPVTPPVSQKPVR